MATDESAFTGIASPMVIQTARRLGEQTDDFLDDLIAAEAAAGRIPEDHGYEVDVIARVLSLTIGLASLCIIEDMDAVEAKAVIDRHLEVVRRVAFEAYEDQRRKGLN